MFCKRHTLHYTRLYRAKKWLVRKRRREEKEKKKEEGHEEDRTALIINLIFGFLALSHHLSSSAADVDLPRRIPPAHVRALLRP